MDICPLCRQHIRDARHGHPHDFVGSLDTMLAGRPCLACNRPHNLPVSREWHDMAERTHSVGCAACNAGECPSRDEGRM